MNTYTCELCVLYWDTLCIEFRLHTCWRNFSIYAIHILCVFEFLSYLLGYLTLVRIFTTQYKEPQRIADVRVGYAVGINSGNKAHKTKNERSE